MILLTLGDPSTDAAYEARPEPTPYPCAECSPHRANMLRAIKEQYELSAVGYSLSQRGEQEAAMVVYRAAESAWDDAIHISNPADPDRSLCGNLGRNLVLLDGPRPDGWGGCWSCLSRADALAGRRDA